MVYLRTTKTIAESVPYNVNNSVLLLHTLMILFTCEQSNSAANNLAQSDWLIIPPREGNSHSCILHRVAVWPLESNRANRVFVCLARIVLNTR